MCLSFFAATEPPDVFPFSLVMGWVGGQALPVPDQLKTISEVKEYENLFNSLVQY